MISHEYKCIFIHIARTGGSSIEKSLVGKNWWEIDQKTKHINIEQSIQIYGREIWDEYFTFTIVRNPWDRLVSMWKRWGNHKTYNNSSKFLDFRTFVIDIKPHVNENYQSLFYSEILNSEIDFIGRYESLQEDYLSVCHKLGRINTKLFHIEKTEHDHYSTFYSDELRDIVFEKFKKDIEMFNYKFQPK